MMILAQAGTPSGPGMPEIWIVLGGLAVVASIAGNYAQWMLARRKRERVTLDQPLEVTFARQFTGLEVFNAHVAKNEREHENLFSKIGGVERGQLARLDSISKDWRVLLDAKMEQLMESNDQGREKLHDRINQILGEMKEMRGELNAQRRAGGRGNQ
jgi:hypothetical protein